MELERADGTDLRPVPVQGLALVPHKSTINPRPPVHRRAAHAVGNQDSFVNHDRRLPETAKKIPEPDRLGPQDLENRYLLAVSYEGLGRYEDALAAVLPVVDNAGGSLKADAELTRGSLLLALKKYAEAIQRWRHSWLKSRRATRR